MIRKKAKSNLVYIPSAGIIFSVILLLLSLVFSLCLGQKEYDVDENGKRTVADNSVNKIKLMTIDGKQVVPVYTDYEPANEAGKAGFIEPEKVKPVGIGFDTVLRLVEQCDGFVINPYSSNNS